MFEISAKKTVWNNNEHDFPHAGTGRAKLTFLLRYAILAPSSHNTQPWKFKITAENAIEIYADESRRLKIADADKREMFVSIGCALENLLIAAEHFGYDTEVEYFPRENDEEFAARIGFTHNPKPRRTRKAQLFESIANRSTFHGTFASAPISLSILQEINAYVEDKGINLFLTTSEPIRHRIDDLTARSDAVQFADPRYRDELAHWIGQGAFGTSWLLSQLGSLAMSYLNLGDYISKNDAGVLRSAPVMGLLTSYYDDRRSQIKAGQAFERIYLAARKEGLGVRPMSQLCEIPKSREELKNIVGLPRNHPQQPFLLGYAEFSANHTPRRNVEEVLI